MDRGLIRHPGLRYLWRGLRREWRQQLLATLCLVLIGSGLFYWSNFQRLAMLITGLILLGIGIGLAINLLLYPPSRHPLRRLLQEQPEQIVWVYSVITERMPFGFKIAHNGILYFKLLDGNEWSVSLPADKLWMTSRILNRLLPKATFGYSPEHERRYKSNPATLKRRRA